MKYIFSISSAAFRLGCSRYGLRHTGDDLNELVFLFNGLHYIAFISWLRSKYPYSKFKVGFKGGYYSVYIKCACLHMFNNWRVYFPSFFIFAKAFHAAACGGTDYSRGWIAAKITHQRRQKCISEIKNYSWGNKFLINNQLI